MALFFAAVNNPHAGPDSPAKMALFFAAVNTGDPMLQ
jgi:hypothetical protein